MTQVIDDEEIIAIFREAFNQTTESDDLINLIQVAEQSVAGNYWRSKSAVTALERLDRNLDSSRHGSIATEKNELQKLYEREKTQQKELYKKTESILAGDASRIINSEYSSNFIRRSVAKRNEQARCVTSSNILSALSQLRSGLRTSTFDLSRRHTVLSSQDVQSIREYAEELRLYLISKGWHRDDIERIPRRMSNKSQSLPEQISEFATRGENTYRYLFFISSVRIDSNNPVDLAKDTVIYPAGYLKPSDLHKIKQTTPYDYGQICKLLYQNTSIAVTVTGYARSQATQRATEQLCEVLDSCSFGKPNSSLKLPQYIDQVDRIRWNIDLDSGPLHGSSQRSFRPAILSEDTERFVQEIHSLTTESGELPERLLRSVRLFRYLNQTGPMTRSIVEQIACLESLISQGNSNQEYIVETAILLAEITDKDHPQVESYLELLYEKRNAILHSGDLAIKSPEEIERAQDTIRLSVLYPIIGRMVQFIQEGKGATMDSFQRHVDREVKRRLVSVSSKIYRDGLFPDNNFRLEGTFVNEKGDKITDGRGNLRVERHGQHFVIICNCRLDSQLSNPISSQDSIWLNASVNGTDIVIGPKAGVEIMFGEFADFTTRNYRRGVKPTN